MGDLGNDGMVPDTGGQAAVAGEDGEAEGTDTPFQAAGTAVIIDRKRSREARQRYRTG